MPILGGQGRKKLHIYKKNHYALASLGQTLPPKGGAWFPAVYSRIHLRLRRRCRLPLEGSPILSLSPRSKVNKGAVALNSY